ncbi:tellurium resistance protein TerA [Streptomyces sp. JNUCC 64]
MNTSEHRPGDDRRREVINLRNPAAPARPRPRPAPSSPSPSPAVPSPPPAPAPAPPPASPPARTPLTRASSRDADRPRIPARTRPTEPPPGPVASDPLVLSADRPQTRIGGRGVLQANLNWRPGVAADLDLGCLASFRAGDGTAVQALGNAYGSLTSWPYVLLDHDDRTGTSADGETLRVDLDRAHLFDRLLLYVYVYEGAVDFRSLGATVTVTAPGRPGAVIHLDDSPSGATACAIALIRPAVDGLSVRRETRWFRPAPELWIQQQIDAAYGFGFQWVYASKDA